MLKPLFIPHASYQNFVIKQLQTHYVGGILVIHSNHWPLISKLWITDLSHITTMLMSLYDDKGPTPRDPASMLRSYLLGLLVRPELSITKWVQEMVTVPLYAILSEFEPGDIPGVGTFYDFFPRLWVAERNHCSPKMKSARSRKRKPKKGKKGEKAPTATPGRVKRLVDWLIPRLDQKTPLPSDRLYAFFEPQILAISAKLGLLGDVSRMNAAGDGTPVVTVINACDSPYDLPSYPRLHPASCHDAVSFVLSSALFTQRFTLGTFDKILLDAAHDAEAIYQFIDHQNQEPIIDLNKRGKKNTAVGNGIQISPEGVPICPKGKKMKPNGFDKSQNRQKWRCSRACGCSTAKYGRTFHTHSKDNLRLFPKTCRETEQWGEITSVVLPSNVPTNERRLITSLNPVTIVRR